MKKLFAILFLLIPLLGISQDIVKYRATHASILKPPSNEWSDLKECTTLITFNKLQIKIYADRLLTIDITAIKNSDVVINGRTYMAYKIEGEDNDGDFVEVYIGDSPNGMKLILNYEKFSVAYLINEI